MRRKSFSREDDKWEKSTRGIQTTHFDESKLRINV